jgi:hypothetical protein
VPGDAVGSDTVDEDNPEEPCAHPDGSFKRIIVLNPDWIEVYTTVLADEPEIVLLPDDVIVVLVFFLGGGDVYLSLGRSPT